MEWLVSVCSGIAVSVITAVVMSFINKKKELVNHAETEQEKRNITTIVREELKPLTEKTNEIYDRTELLSRGVQAGLRHDLCEIYDAWKDKEYCPREVKDDFENIYKNYHALGSNGVMDSYREKLINMPDTPKDR